LLPCEERTFFSDNAAYFLSVNVTQDGRVDKVGADGVNKGVVLRLSGLLFSHRFYVNTLSKWHAYRPIEILNKKYL